MSDSFQMPRPGVQHRRLEPFVGTFRATVKLFFGPGEPQVSQGTMVNSWDLDGLYLQQHYTGDPAPPPYPAFVGRGYWGFNFATQKYEGFWIDNASSIMQTEAGEVDSAGTVWTMLSEFSHPASAKPVSKRSVIRLFDRDRHSIESWVSGEDGVERLAMEIVYTRLS